MGIYKKLNYDKSIRFKLEKELFEKFKEVVKDKNTTMSDFLRDLVRKEIEKAGK